MPRPYDVDCDHPGQHSRGNPCPECSKFMAHSWDTGPSHTPNGFFRSWGGTCKVHGDQSDSV